MNERTRRDSVWVGVAALAARLLVVLWAGARFGPTADGTYYHRIASRIADGLGYTWLWPDGAVTYAAHYPIGYPALLGLVYRLTGPSVVAAGIANALLGTLAAVAAYGLIVRAAGRRAALAGGMAVALHPGLLLYTPALMTEGVAAALLTLAVWLAARARDAAEKRAAALVGLGLALGAATLVRPQSIAIAPFLGLLASAPGARWRVRATSAAAVTALALALCAPWTARNCVRMNRCALVSVNGGWNLLIGAGEKATGTWSPVDVPVACREVWGEADKDACFGREAGLVIAKDPLRWLALAPRKLAGTFDYCGAGGWYLHDANPAAFDDRAKLVAGAVETLYERLAWLGALAAAGLVGGPRRRLRVGLAALGAVFLFATHAWPAVVLLLAALGLLGRDLLRGPVLVSGAFVVLGLTAATHAVFFGAGRYGLVVLPLVTALAATAKARATLTGARPEGDTRQPPQET